MDLREQGQALLQEAEGLIKELEVMDLPDDQRFKHMRAIYPVKVTYEKMLQAVLEKQDARTELLDKAMDLAGKILKDTIMQVKGELNMGMETLDDALAVVMQELDKRTEISKDIDKLAQDMECEVSLDIDKLAQDMECEVSLDIKYENGSKETSTKTVTMPREEAVKLIKKMMDDYSGVKVDGYADDGEKLFSLESDLTEFTTPDTESSLTESVNALIQSVEKVIREHPERTPEVGETNETSSQTGTERTSCGDGHSCAGSCDCGSENGAAQTKEEGIKETYIGTINVPAGVLKEFFNMIGIDPKNVLVDLESGTLHLKDDDEDDECPCKDECDTSNEFYRANYNYKDEDEDEDEDEDNDECEGWSDETVSQCSDCPHKDDCFDDEDDDVWEDLAEKEELESWNSTIREFLAQERKPFTDQNLFSPYHNVFYYHTEENGLWSKYIAREVGQGVIDLRSDQTGQPASPAVNVGFLEGNTEHFATADEILVLTWQKKIERALIFDDLTLDGFDAFLVLTKEGHVQIAARHSESYYRYLLRQSNALEQWSVNTLNLEDWAEQILRESHDHASKFIFPIILAAYDVFAALFPELPYDTFLKLSAFGDAFNQLLSWANNYNATQLELTSSQTVNPNPAKGSNEHLKVDGAMSLKHIDDIHSVGGAIGDGQRHLILDAPRYNEYVAYVSAEENRLPNGGRRIHYGQIVEEKHYDDFEIKIVTLESNPKQLIIQDSQIVRELTDYLQMTDDDKFVLNLIFHLQSHESIVSGVRCPLILIPDPVEDEIVCFYRTNSKQMAHNSLSVEDYRKVAGAKYGMSAYLDLDILGGYIHDRSK